MNVLEIILITIGVWQIIFSLIVETKNFISSIVYKVVPFFSGVYCIFFALLSSEVLNIVIK